MIQGYKGSNILFDEPIKSINDLDSLIILYRSLIKSKDIFRITVVKRLEGRYFFSIPSAFIFFRNIVRKHPVLFRTPNIGPAVTI